VNETTFGPYRLVALLGRGGMGEVFRAFDTTTERVVALKVLPAHLAEDEGFKQRFRREAHAAARLNEPHVIPIHNFGEIDGRLYVDMRFVDGHDLESVLKAGAMSVDRAVDIITQVASALTAAHDVGLAHRDIKPSNIIIGERDFAYLIDFGIARTAAETALTATGMAIGTFAYMAPERFQSSGVDTRSDVYALACVLHQCLTGKQPFPGNTAERQIAAHLMSPVPQPSALRPDLNPAMDTVIALGMAKDADKRYQTASDLARAAYSATAPERHIPNLAVTQRAPSTPPSPTPSPPSPTPSPPSPSPSPGGQWWRRPAVLTTAAAVILAASVSAVLFAGRDGDSATAVTASSTPTSVPDFATSAPSLKPPVDLDSLLLTPDEMSSATGIPGLQVDRRRFTVPYEKATDSTVPAECLAVSHFMGHQMLEGSGWTALRRERLNVPAGGSATAYQVVVEFPSDKLATNVVDRTAAAWQECNRKPYSTDGGQTWEAIVTSVPGRATSVATPIRTPSWRCESVTAAVREFVIETRTCRDGGGGGAIRIADEITARLSRA
jgi:serine/threonine kinase PknH